MKKTMRGIRRNLTLFDTDGKEDAIHPLLISSELSIGKTTCSPNKETMNMMNITPTRAFVLSSLGASSNDPCLCDVVIHLSRNDKPALDVVGAILVTGG